jgi:hypothetical protein
LQRFLYSLDDLIVQLAKIVKISEKIRIFAPGYAKHIISDMQAYNIPFNFFYGRNHTRNRIIM